MFFTNPKIKKPDLKPNVDIDKNIYPVENNNKIPLKIMVQLIGGKKNEKI